MQDIQSDYSVMLKQSLLDDDKYYLFMYLLNEPSTLHDTVTSQLDNKR